MHLGLAEKQRWFGEQGTEVMAGGTESGDACSEGIRVLGKESEALVDITSLGDRTYETPQYLLQ